MVVTNQAGNVETAPRLLDTELTDDVRPGVATTGVRRNSRTRLVREVHTASNAGAVEVRLDRVLRIFDCDRARNAVAELVGVGHREAERDVIRRAGVTVHVVRGVAVGAVQVGRADTTDREAAPLHDCSVEAEARRCTGGADRRISLEPIVLVGTQRAERRLSPGVHEQEPAGTGEEEVLITGVRRGAVTHAQGLKPRTARVERNFRTNVTTNADASVSARDVIESRAIQGADLHVFDRLGLYGKIGCLRPRHCGETCR